MKRSRGGVTKTVKQIMETQFLEKKKIKLNGSRK